MSNKFKEKKFLECECPNSTTKPLSGTQIQALQSNDPKVTHCNLLI